MEKKTTLTRSSSSQTLTKPTATGMERRIPSLSSLYPTTPSGENRAANGGHQRSNSWTPHPRAPKRRNSSASFGSSLTTSPLDGSNFPSLGSQGPVAAGNLSTGIAQDTTQALSSIATQENTSQVLREVNPFAALAIEILDAISKNMADKGKSTDYPPLRPLVPFLATLSKAANDPNKCREYQAINTSELAQSTEKIRDIRDKKLTPLEEYSHYNELGSFTDQVLNIRNRITTKREIFGDGNPDNEALTDRAIGLKPQQSMDLERAKLVFKNLIEAIILKNYSASNKEWLPTLNHINKALASAKTELDCLGLLHQFNSIKFPEECPLKILPNKPKYWVEKGGVSLRFVKEGYSFNPKSELPISTPHSHNAPVSGKFLDMFYIADDKGLPICDQNGVPIFFVKDEEENKYYKYIQTESSPTSTRVTFDPYTLQSSEKATLVEVNYYTEFSLKNNKIIESRSPVVPDVDALTACKRRFSSFVEFYYSPFDIQKLKKGARFNSLTEEERENITKLVADAMRIGLGDGISQNKMLDIIKNPKPDPAHPDIDKMEVIRKITLEYRLQQSFFEFENTSYDKALGEVSPAEMARKLIEREKTQGAMNHSIEAWNYRHPQGVSLNEVDVVYAPGLTENNVLAGREEIRKFLSNRRNNGYPFPINPFFGWEEDQNGDLVERNIDHLTKALEESKKNVSYLAKNQDVPDVTKAEIESLEDVYKAMFAIEKLKMMPPLSYAKLDSKDPAMKDLDHATIEKIDLYNKKEIDTYNDKQGPKLIKAYENLKNKLDSHQIKFKDSDQGGNILSASKKALKPFDDLKKLEDKLQQLEKLDPKDKKRDSISLCNNLINLIKNPKNIELRSMIKEEETNLTKKAIDVSDLMAIGAPYLASCVTTPRRRPSSAPVGTRRGALFTTPLTTLSEKEHEK